MSDLECASCVEYIFSHMISRFKGELAELLALQPCFRLIQDLQDQEVLPRNIEVFWGDAIKQHQRPRKSTQYNSKRGPFAKGADGLIVERVSPRNELNIHGIVEIKSMVLSKKKILAQISKHCTRLKSGVRLQDEEWFSGEIFFCHIQRILVVPSTWKLSREYHYDTSGQLWEPLPKSPPAASTCELIEKDTWKIKLAWSYEALTQAACEMTFWYMGEVGKRVISEKNPSPHFKSSTDAGRNAIKEMLYHLLLRPLSKRHRRIATRLYNIYGYGYPLGVESTEMIWPEEIETLYQSACQKQRIRITKARLLEMHQSLLEKKIIFKSWTKKHILKKIKKWNEYKEQQ